MMEEYTIKRDEMYSKNAWRPEYHFTAPTSWINDPNGLIYFKDWYHLFYQYAPYECEWGSMHWGHAISKDMLHWADLPIALTPDQDYDNHPEGGCFSGTAIEHDQKLYLFYTSVTHRGGKVYQTQSIAISEDGIHFQKFDGNPVIGKPPQGASCDFRDPKVFRHGNNWYMVIGGSIGGAADPEGDGRVFLYRSDDLYSWTFIGNLLESDGRMGTMFECPDLFEVNGKWVLTCSPIRHPQYNKAMYCVGELDLNTAEFRIERTGSLDIGFDFYAPQSLLDKNGERVMIAWANEWQWMPWFRGWGPTSPENWRGSLTIPRKVTLNDDLSVNLEPIDEVRKLQKHHRGNINLRITDKKHYLQPGKALSYRLHMLLVPEHISAKYLEIGIFASADGQKEMLFSLDFVSMSASLNKRNADKYSEGVMNTAIETVGGQIDIEMLVDHSIVEVFINHGRVCISSNVYPEACQRQIWIRTPYQGAMIDLLEISDMSSVWDSFNFQQPFPSEREVNT